MFQPAMFVYRSVQRGKRIHSWPSRCCISVTPSSWPQSLQAICCDDAKHPHQKITIQNGGPVSTVQPGIFFLENQWFNLPRFLLKKRMILYQLTALPITTVHEIPNVLRRICPDFAPLHDAFADNLQTSCPIPIRDATAKQKKSNGATPQTLEREIDVSFF